MTEPVPLKVLTLNTHKGFTAFNRRFVLAELREAVRAAGADVVFLQEVIGAHTRLLDSLKRPMGAQYEFLADSIWTAYAYGRNAVYDEGHHGNAVLSKFPILDYQNHDISDGRHERRGLLHCKLQTPFGALHAICVHLGLLGRQRRRQLDRLCELVARAVPPSAPLIVAGDFNDWRSVAHGVLGRCAALREVFVEREQQAARSFPARFPLLRLDRIYIRNLRIRATAVLALRPWSHLSDHAGLLAEVQAARVDAVVPALAATETA